MISSLVVIICILALFQSDHNRSVAAIIYAAVCGVHSILFYDLHGEYYYLSAAVSDLVVIVGIGILAKPTRLADNLMDVCLISIALNSFGFLTWWQGLPPEAYNLSYVALYLIAILALLREDCADGYQPSKRNSRIRLSIRGCVEYCRQLQGAEK